jgi:hypothetical protein
MWWTFVACTTVASYGFIHDRDVFARWAAAAAASSVIIQCLTVACAQRGVPTPTQMAALLLVAGDAAGLLGAWLHADPRAAWELNRWQTAIALAAVWYGQARRRAWILTLAPK